MGGAGRLTWAFIAIVACGGPAAENGPSPSEAPGSAERPEACPGQVAAPSPLPGVQPEERTLAYWLERQAGYGDLDAPLMDPEDVTGHNAAMHAGEAPLLASPLGEVVDANALRQQLAERFDYMRERVQSGLHREADGSGVTDLSAFDLPDQMSFTSELRVAHAFVPVHCAPRTEGLFTESLDHDFDRNLCFTVRPQEVLEVLAAWPNGMRLIRTLYGIGFVSSDAPLTPAVDDLEVRAALLSGKRQVVAQDFEHEGVEVPAGSLLAATCPDCAEFYVGTPAGLGTVDVSGRPTARALTRRTFFEEAFSMLDAPYGWGGRAGGRDCSRFVLDTFARFDVSLPRHSSVQANAGSYVVDVEGMAADDKKLLFETAARQGVVLLHFPGHIMVYLGQSEGRPMALHSFSEYVTPCMEDGRAVDGVETVHRVDRVDVSDLTLGEGSSRTDFLSRVTKVTIFGKGAGPLAGAAVPRPVQIPARPEDDAECEDSVDHGVFRSPFRPNPTQPLRVIVTSTSDPGPVRLAIYGPSGELVDGDLHELGGPPFTHWFEKARPQPGRYVAVLGDGPRTVACERFTVARAPPAIEPRMPTLGPAWVSTWSWERDTENLYSAFVEQLFREPVDEDRTWSSLHELLRDPTRNLLYNHRHLNEDMELSLQPDCADLPYFLRGYFAWKVKLPFAWRQCRRGRDGQPPRCEPTPTSNMQEVEAVHQLEAFRQIIRVIGRNVHSSTDRTVPSDDASDVYPVPLTRYALRPGTVFADPFGHVLVVAGWKPQTLDDYGVLVGADAQPDGTVGRRRFWRGSFLFTPDTRHSGSGFKNWRPVAYDRREESISVMTNQELTRTSDFTRYSEQQYEGSADDFYDRMEAVINPRPLPPQAVLGSLVDALHESVQRRVVSVDNGEEWVQSHGPRMEMPEAASIFQTAGPWEDFATPSRDMRLLISIDAVAGFADTIRRAPERFGVTAEDVERVASEVEATLREALTEKRFEYRRSDGQAQALTLADLLARQEALEMAYNPNDCIEIRWGAPEGSDEIGSCRRHAPRAQRRRMGEYRNWFRTRQRPAR